MKPILALGAALLLTTVSAQARRLTEISLDGYCNIFHVVQQDGLVSVQDTPSCSGTFGGGFIGSASGYGKQMVLAIQDASSPGVQRMISFSYPFTTGGTFSLFETNTGTDFHLALDGTYSIIEADRVAKSARSITSRR